MANDIFSLILIASLGIIVCKRETRTHDSHTKVMFLNFGEGKMRPIIVYHYEYAYAETARTLNPPRPHSPIETTRLVSSSMLVSNRWSSAWR